MKKSILLLLILTAIFLISCQKFETVVDDTPDTPVDNQTTTAITKMSDLVISEDFDWSMIKTMDVEITIPNEANRQITRIFSLDRSKMYFNGYPEDNSNILKTRVTFPTYVENVLVEYGNGSNGIVVNIAGKQTSLIADLNSTIKSTWALHTTATQSIYKTTPSCDVDLSGTYGAISIEDGEIYCIAEGTTVTTGDITFNGGTLNVKGELIVNGKIKVQGNKGGYLYITSVGSINADQILFTHFDEFINYGTVTETSNGGPSVAADVLFENHGTMNCNGIVNQSEDFLNTGIMNVEGQFNNNGIGTNEGTIYVTGPNGHFNNTGNPSVKFYNYCAIYVEQHFNNNSKFYHYGYIEVDKKTNITGSGNTFFEMGKYSLVVTEDLQISGEVFGPDENGAKFKVAVETKLTGATNMTGYIQICDADGTIEVNNGTLGANVNFGCDLEIPSNDCNPGDEPPIDPPDPPDTETFEGTLAYEDLWPGKGDYDINDLVVEYDFDISKNAQEKVEHITASFMIRAFGATLHNGFGFTFPNVDPSDIVSVTGYDIASGSVYNMAANGTEIGASAATFIVVDDPYRVMTHPGVGIGVNTDPFAPYVSPVTLVLEIEFVPGAVTYSQLDIGSFNPFIVKDQDRGIEIHLPNYKNTELADVSHFGTWEDDTNPPDKYYLTQDNLPWGIHIPERFDYPVERQLILGAYYHFAEWAQGDGTVYADWYKDLPGYRNASVIY